MMNDGDETKPIESKMLARMVTMAQTKIEGINYDSRKNVLKYDDVIRRQRETFYEYTDLFNAHHFDCRGLIEKGLALEAPEDMYKEK